jgi:hypothetical protein
VTAVNGNLKRARWALYALVAVAGAAPPVLAQTVPPATTPAPPAAGSPLEQPPSVAPVTPTAPQAEPSPDLSQQFSAADAASSTETRQQARSNRLAQAPEMFGDSLMPAQMSATTLLNIGSDLNFVDTVVSFPIGISQRVSDQNSPLPEDRIYYRYSDFDDAATMSSGFRFFGSSTYAETFYSDRSLSVHTVGVEKTFCDDLWSIELRMPFAQRREFSETREVGSYLWTDSLVYGGEGNLFVIGKMLIHEGEELAIAVGMGIDTATGRDASYSLISDQSLVGLTTLEYQNEAVYLSPFITGVWTPTERWFHQGWFGVTTPVGENEFTAYNTLFGTTTQLFDFDMNEMTLVTVDWLTGYWVCRDQTRPILKGLAFIGELHYTTSTEGADTVTFDPGFIFSPEYSANPSSLGRFDVLNFTSAVHLQLGDRLSVRLGHVTPLADEPFSNEFSVQSIYTF